MKRYNLLTEGDLVKGEYYECITLFGNNPHPRSETIFYDRYGNWCVETSHVILEVMEDSVMRVLKKQNPNRYLEIINGGSYEDGKYNDERCKSSYNDCESA
jgi:hypothetical protein